MDSAKSKAFWHFLDFDHWKNLAKPASRLDCVHESSQVMAVPFQSLELWSLGLRQTRSAWKLAVLRKVHQKFSSLTCFATEILTDLTGCACNHNLPTFSGGAAFLKGTGSSQNSKSSKNTGFEHLQKVFFKTFLRLVCRWNHHPRLPQKRELIKQPKCGNNLTAQNLLQWQKPVVSLQQRHLQAFLVHAGQVSLGLHSNLSCVSP